MVGGCGVRHQNTAVPSRLGLQSWQPHVTLHKHTQRLSEATGRPLGQDGELMSHTNATDVCCIIMGVTEGLAYILDVASYPLRTLSFLVDSKYGFQNVYPILRLQVS